MSLRKEHVVLGGTVLVLAALYLTSGSSQKATASKARPEAPALESSPVPDTSLALPQKFTGTGFDRDVFAPPRDTRPLPPLELELPPLPSLAALAPPPSPYFDSGLFGRFLRTNDGALPTPVPGLFASAESADDGFNDSLDDTGGAGTAADVTEPAVPLDQLTPDQRAALVAGYKKLYDSIRLEGGEPLFGQIRNPDRYGLRSRKNEDVLFVEVRPETGAERFPGQKPVPYARARVGEDFEFADTPSNRIGLKRREFLGNVGPGQKDALLTFADECVSLRLAAREALGVAEELYTRAAQIDAEDPAPKLGLARCYEAGFQLEKAYEVYQSLAERYAHRAEVHVGLGELEARLRLFDSAEAHLKEAESLARSNWGVQLALGSFLADRGRHEESVPHLRDAFKFEPTEPPAAPTRARIRTTLGRALLATGALDEAASMFEKAMAADPGDADALAGRIAALRLGAKGTAPAATTGSASFDLALARAFGEMTSGNWVAARDLLQLAAGTSPLRASEAWRALSWLAERTGYPEDSVRWIESALEADPTDTWAMYQHGRLLAARDDVQGAREAFVRALDREIDFTDALVGLGQLSQRAGDHAAAERYFERALSIEPKRADVLALRGLNLVQLGDLGAARDAFEAALALDSLQPLARVGQAWTTYRGGDPDKSRTQFAELNDVRRSLPESDPFRVFALAQMARIEDHTSKVVWSDTFERLALKNEWEVEEAAGPTAQVVDGALHLEGTFNQNGTARVFRNYAAAEFLAFELDITAPADSNAKVGVFISKERRVGVGQTQVQTKFAIARRRDGGLVVLLMDAATAEENWIDIPAVGGQPWWPAGKSVRVRFERIGEGNEATGRLSIDGIPVREGFKLPRLAASTQDVRVGVFLESQSGLTGKVVIDNVDVTRRTRK